MRERLREQDIRVQAGFIDSRESPVVQIEPNRQRTPPRTLDTPSLRAAVPATSAFTPELNIVGHRYGGRAVAEAVFGNTAVVFERRRRARTEQMSVGHAVRLSPRERLRSGVHPRLGEFDA